MVVICGIVVLTGDGSVMCRWRSVFELWWAEDRSRRPRVGCLPFRCRPTVAIDRFLYSLQWDWYDDTIIFFERALYAFLFLAVLTYALEANICHSWGTSWRFIKPWSARALSTHARCGPHHWPGSSRINWSPFSVVSFESYTPNLSYARALHLCGETTPSQGHDNFCKQLFRDILKPSHKLHHLLPQPMQDFCLYSLRKRSCCPTIGRSSRFRQTLIPWPMVWNSRSIKLSFKSFPVPSEYL